MIQYSPRAARAIGYLKRQLNEIEIYVEDTSGFAMWTRLLETLVPPGIRFKSVTMLGGRSQVLAACALDQANDGRRRLYIIDGDYDFLLGLGKPRLKYLYRLRAYCVENLLLDRDAITELAFDSGSFGSRAAAAAALDFAGVLDAAEADLRRLFVEYAAAYSLAPSVPTIAGGVMRLTHKVGKADRLSSESVTTRILGVARLVMKSRSPLDHKRKRMQIAERALNIPLEMAVSGKDYILPLIWRQLQHACGCRYSPSQVLVQLSRQFKSTAEPYFVRRLSALWGG